MFIVIINGTRGIIGRRYTYKIINEHMCFIIVYAWITEKKLVVMECIYMMIKNIWFHENHTKMETQNRHKN